MNPSTYQDPSSQNALSPISYRSNSSLGYTSSVDDTEDLHALGSPIVLSAQNPNLLRASHRALMRTRNPAYIHLLGLYKESKVRANTLQKTYDSLIDALRQGGGSTHAVHPNQPASASSNVQKPMPPTKRQEDYPNITYWRFETYQQSKRDEKRVANTRDNVDGGVLKKARILTSTPLHQRGDSNAREQFLISTPSREDSNNASRLSTPLQRIKLRSDSRPPTPGSCQPTVAHAHALHPKQPVRTRQQLYDRLAMIDRSVAHSQDAHFRHHLLRVSESQDTCDRLLSRIDQVDTAVANASQKLLAKQMSLMVVSSFTGSTGGVQTAIWMTLEYLLSVTGARDAAAQSPWRVARSPDRMVERVDICIEFLKPHRNYKEAEVYLLRFQQCMTCAMTFIKMYFVGSLRALTQDVSRRLFEQDVTDTAQMHLLYTRFTTVAGQLAPLLGEFERRAHSHPEELGALLSECHGAYFGARKNLLVSRLTEQIRGLTLRDGTRGIDARRVQLPEVDLH
ncbi:hypothetical protein BGW80DRAFT_1564997 [Lactifluus volemus]|nr:hypothetical protein BGW80DRAFT_1564997 [Lactifluus volemus]